MDEAYIDLTDYLVRRQNLQQSERTFPKLYETEDGQQPEMITFETTVEGCVQEIRHRIYLATKLTASAGTFLTIIQNISFIL